jgi:long-chain acyl-CoA synthetase
MPIELEDLTVRSLLRRSFALYRHLPAIAFVGEPLMTFGEVEGKIEALAGQLSLRGIRGGDKVAILGENSPEWVMAYLTVTSLGAVAVPILPGFPDSDVRHIIRNSEAVAVFVSEHQEPKIEGAELPKVRSIFSLEDFSLEEIQKPATGLLERARHVFGKEDKDRQGASEPLGDTAAPGEDDLAVIIYTSGTTGHSKGVMLTHRNIVSDAVGSIERFPIDSTDRFLSVLPLSHTFEATGGMLCPLAVGASVHYLKGLPAPRKLLSAMETVRPTVILLVPLIFDKIYRKRVLGEIETKRLGWLYRISGFRKLLNRIAGKKLMQAFGGHIRVLMLGGASLNEDLEVFLRDARIGYSTGYGMTEASPILTISPLGRVKPGSCGLAIPEVEIRIFDADPVTGVGEITVRGPNIMKGYYRNEEKTREVFTREGWLKTGDIGYLDRDSYLFIKGRSKNVIVDASGENIYPEIIEHKLIKHPYIEQALVCLRNGRLVARVHLDQDLLDKESERRRLSEAETRALIQDLLERTRVEVNGDLPAFSAIQEMVEQPEPFEMTPTNKIKRYLYVD